MYQQRIQKLLTFSISGAADLDPRHIEAYMRLENSTLDGLSEPAFRQECVIAAYAVKHDPDGAERLARSFGL